MSTFPTIDAAHWRTAFQRHERNDVSAQIAETLQPTVVLSSAVLGVEVLQLRNREGSVVYCFRKGKHVRGPFTSATEATLNAIFHVSPQRP